MAVNGVMPVRLRAKDVIIPLTQHTAVVIIKVIIDNDCWRGFQSRIKIR